LTTLECYQIQCSYHHYRCSYPLQLSTAVITTINIQLSLLSMHPTTADITTINASNHYIDITTIKAISNCSYHGYQCRQTLQLSSLSVQLISAAIVSISPADHCSYRLYQSSRSVQLSSLSVQLITAAIISISPADHCSYRLYQSS